MKTSVGETCHKRIEKLLQVLNRLVERGNTVIVIEHNMEVAKIADWVLDLGPGGGEHGGEVVTEGPPEKVVRSRKSAPLPREPSTRTPLEPERNSLLGSPPGWHK